MDKIAIVIQRYGLEVNGGAEFHARILAEQLNKRYEITVLTTRSTDYGVWGNDYPKGETIINGVNTIRFDTDPRDRLNNARIHLRLVKNNTYNNRKLTLSNFVSLIAKRFRYRFRKKVFNSWLDAQGPKSEELINYLRENKEEYSAFIFFTYLYYPTVVGIKEVADKSILIPTAHDEESFYFKGFKKFFTYPRFIMYNTLSEKRLVEKIYPYSKNIENDIAGVGFDTPVIDTSYTKIPDTGFEYFIYIGRIDQNKGCAGLIECFEEYNTLHGKKYKLIMVGQNFMSDLPENENVIVTGFVDEQAKLYYLRDSLALIIPSKYESLSMVTLEAMAMGKPVIANGNCEVLKDHIDASKAGYIFFDNDDLIKQLDKIVKLTDRERHIIAENGINYVRKNYDWAHIIGKFEKAVDYIKNK